MIIKKIKLENIRSYVNEEISLDTGSTLLAGDIGSGKSTILLALEFALFGIKRSTLEGSMLLRHGAKENPAQGLQRGFHHDLSIGAAFGGRAHAGSPWAAPPSSSRTI